VFRESHSCVLAVETRTPPRTALPPPLHCFSGARSCVKSAICHRTLRIASVGGVLRGPERPTAMQALPALSTYAAKLWIRPRCDACGGSHLSGSCSTPREQPQCCGCRRNHTANYRGCEVERSEGRTCKAGAQSWAKERRHSPPYRSERTAGRALCRADGPGRGVESRRPRGRVVKATIPTTPIPNPPSQTVTEAFEQHKVTATRKTTRPQV